MSDNTSREFTVRRFPSLYGMPRSFRFKITAYSYALLLVIFTQSTVEIAEPSGVYRAYWPLGVK